MFLDFQNAEWMFRENRIRELGQTPDGLLYLKLRSLSRKKYLERLFDKASLTPQSTLARQMFREVYEAKVDVRTVDDLIREIYEEERAVRRETEDELISELYRLQVFDWGGLHQSGLERTIVNNYVKRTRRYNELCEKIENELQGGAMSCVRGTITGHQSSSKTCFEITQAFFPLLGKSRR